MVPEAKFNFEEFKFDYEITLTVKTESSANSSTPSESDIFFVPQNGR